MDFLFDDACDEAPRCHHHGSGSTMAPVVEPNPTRSNVRHGGSILITSLAMLVFNIATGVMLARLLGPAGRGQLAATLLWPGLLGAIGSLGLSEAVVYLAARMPGKERVVSATALTVAFCQSAALGVAWYVIAPSILQRYGEEAVFVSRLMVLSIPLMLVSIATAGVLLGRLDIRSYNRQRLMGTVLTTLGLLGLYAFREGSLVAVVSVYLIVGVLTTGYGLARLIRQRWFGFRADPSLIRNLLSYGVRSHIGTVSGIANERADQALISIVLPPTYLGLYAVALTLPSAIAIIGNSLATIALPAITAVNSPTEMRRTLGRFVRTTLILSVLAAGILSALTSTLIGIFFGSPFLAAVPIAQVLLLASILLSVNRVMSAGLRSFNRPFKAGAGDLLAACVTVVALGLLVPKIGLMGAAIASVLAYGANLAFNVWTCGQLGVSARELFVPSASDVRFLRTTLRSLMLRRT
jgi:O-antigen/teichoic acid export membrane protein